MRGRGRLPAAPARFYGVQKLKKQGGWPSLRAECRPRWVPAFDGNAHAEVSPKPALMRWHPFFMVSAKSACP